MTKKENPLEMAAELLRKGSTAANYRESLNILNTLLAKPELRERLTVSKEDRHVLSKQLNLRQEDWLELEASTFRLLDAHHLEYVFLMRDAVRALELEGQPPLVQAALCFQWVTRQIRLREGDMEVVPPVYVLQRASGNSVERILVFLGLLQQLQIDGCALRLTQGAASAPIHLAGARVGDDKSAEIHVFDPRLGRSLGTLTEIRKKPDFVEAIKPGTETKIEVLFASPLTALAPRMQVLEDWLAPQDRVILAVPPAKTFARLASAAGADVELWTAGRTKEDSPLRLLRQFLPKEEGGIDQTDQARFFPRQIVPLSAVRHYFIEWKLTEFIPPAEERLLFLTALLFNQYSQVPQDMLIRGRYEFMSKRLNSIRTVLEDLEFAADPDAAFKEKLADWRERARQVYLEAGKGASDPRVTQFWSEDQFLVELLQNPDDRDPRRSRDKGTLTILLLTAVKDSIGPEVAYRQALSWQEKAERAQALLESPRLEKRDADAVREAADEAGRAWINAGDWWTKFSWRTSLAPAQIAAKLDPIRHRWNTNNVETSLSLWEQLGRDIHYAALARFYLARAWTHLDKADAARTALENLEAELAALQKNEDLTKVLAACFEQAGNFSTPHAALRLQALSRDILSDNGALHWLRRNGQRALKELKK